MAERKTVRDNVTSRSLEATDPSDLIELITQSDTVGFTNGQCRAINAADDAVVDLVLPDGTVIADYQLHKGYNPVSAIRVNAGGDAVPLWALF